MGNGGRKKLVLVSLEDILAADYGNGSADDRNKRREDARLAADQLGKGLTWRYLVKEEPGLGVLLADCKSVVDPGDTAAFCANRVWVDVYKPRLVKLVGWSSRHPNPVLQSEVAYNMAYRRIYDALPPCRGCWCW